MSANWKDVRKSIMTREEVEANKLAAEELVAQAYQYLPLENNLLVRKEENNNKPALYIPDSPRVATRARVIAAGAEVSKNLVGYVIVLGSPLDVVGVQLDHAGELFMLMYDQHTVRGVDLNYDPIIVGEEDRDEGIY